MFVPAFQDIHRLDIVGQDEVDDRFKLGKVPFAFGSLLLEVAGESRCKLCLKPTNHANAASMSSCPVT